MTLFIQNGNMKIIWEVISMCPLLSKTFPTEVSQKEWFNDIIARIHIQMNKSITMEELGNVNRNAIKVMMANLKENYLKVSTDIESRDRPLAIGTDTDSPFMRRQSEYDTMKSVYVPPQIDFRSIEVDVPITNMSELVEKHLNERNRTMDVVLSLDNKIEKNVSWTTPIETFYPVVDVSSMSIDKDYKNESMITNVETFSTVDDITLKNNPNLSQTIMDTLHNLNSKVDNINRNILSMLSNATKTVLTRSTSV